LTAAKDPAMQCKGSLVELSPDIRDESDWLIQQLLHFRPNFRDACNPATLSGAWNMYWRALEVIYMQMISITEQQHIAIEVRDDTQ